MSSDKAKHTPGPWTASPYYEDRGQCVYIYGTVGANKPCVATVRFGLNFGQDIEAETVANARLIAAAPKMREALELFLKQWNACGPNSDFGRYFSNVRDAAEAALNNKEE